MAESFPVVIGNSQRLAIPVSPTDTVKCLVHPFTAWVTTGIFSLDDSETQATYQVPVGKIFKATHIKFLTYETTTYSNFMIWESNTVNTQDGNRKMFGYGAQTGQLDSNTDMDCLLEFAASKFVTIYNAGDSISAIVLGVETDA